MKMRITVTAATVLLGLVAGIGGLFLSGALTSRAVQNPSIAFDMVTTGTSYDDTTNTMTVGTTENCLTTVAPGNNLTHTHPVQIVIKNVEDMIGWQARLNYLGDKMRPNTVSFTPFTDTGLAQAISFNNLP